MIETISPLTASENLSAYNGWTVFDRANRLVDGAPVVQIGLYATSPLQWRPKMARRLSPAKTSQWLIIYSHPAMVNHPGAGWHWIETLSPLAPWEGAMYAGAYFSGGASVVMAMSQPRAELQGDAEGIVGLEENQWPAPAIGVRYWQ